MTHLETIGSLYLETQRLLLEYGKLLDLVQRAKIGEVSLEQIEINPKEQSWSLTLTGKEFAEAMQPKTEQ